MAFRIRLRISLPHATCPECSSTRVRRQFANRYIDRPHAWVTLTLTLRAVFVCRECDCRFWDFIFKAPFSTRPRRMRPVEFDSDADV